MTEPFQIEEGVRYVYRTPPRDAVTVVGVDKYSVNYIGPNGRANMSRSMFFGMFEPKDDR